MGARVAIGSVPCRVRTPLLNGSALLLLRAACRRRRAGRPSLIGLMVLLQATVDAGTLVVRPLTVEWLGRTADLLTDVFATLGGPGFVAYRRYMRNQIRGFLEVPHLEAPWANESAAPAFQPCIPWRGSVAVPSVACIAPRSASRGACQINLHCMLS